MLYRIYKLRKDGEKLPLDVVRASVLTYKLRIGKHRYGQPVQVAELIEGKDHVHTWLEYVVVKKMTDAGVLITGSEPLADIRHNKQTWWCMYVESPSDLGVESK